VQNWGDQVKSRKLDVPVDTPGLILFLVVTSARRSSIVLRTHPKESRQNNGVDRITLRTEVKRETLRDATRYALRAWFRQWTDAVYLSGKGYWLDQLADIFGWVETPNAVSKLAAPPNSQLTDMQSFPFANFAT